MNDLWLSVCHGLFTLVVTFDLHWVQLSSFVLNFDIQISDLDLHSETVIRRAERGLT